jgi:hypothetical protein
MQPTITLYYLITTENVTMSINNYRFNQFSQNGEDGILQEVFKRLKITKGKAVEFGAPTMQYCSNIYKLKQEGWDCLYLDSDPQEPGIVKTFVTPENINDLIPAELDLLSADTDGGDYEIWKAYKGTAKVVVIEINSSLHPDVDYYTLKDGANFSIMNNLAESKGYFLLCHSGNCIYIQNQYRDLFPDADTTFDTSWLPR